MIEVNLGTNAGGSTVIVPASYTVKEVLEENNIDYTGATITLDGCPLDPSGLNRSLEGHGIKDKCFIAATVKQVAG